MLMKFIQCYYRLFWPSICTWRRKTGHLLPDRTLHRPGIGRPQTEIRWMEETTLRYRGERSFDTVKEEMGTLTTAKAVSKEVGELRGNEQVERRQRDCDNGEKIGSYSELMDTHFPTISYLG